MSVFSVTRDTQLTSHEICSLGLGCSKINNPILAWNITLTNVPKPPILPLKPPKVLIEFLLYYESGFS